MGPFSSPSGATGTVVCPEKGRCTELVFLLVGLAVGGIAVWLVLRARVLSLRTELEHERRAVAGETAAREQLETSLKALSADLQRDAREDLESRQRSVERMIAPLKESLEKVTTGLQEVERGRSAASGALSAQIRDLVEAQARLQGETASLASAMRASGARGRWGEAQLRRVVELAGMVAYCDFVEQATFSTGDRVLRPDLVVRLPGGRNIVIDAKVPFDAYLQASNETTEEAKRAQSRCTPVRSAITSPGSAQRRTGSPSSPRRASSCCSSRPSRSSTPPSSTIQGSSRTRRSRASCSPAPPR